SGTAVPRSASVPGFASLNPGYTLSLLLPLHIERDRDGVDSLARLNHVLCRLRILLEVRRLQMRLERGGVLIDFEQTHPCRIVLFEHRVEAQTPGFGTDRGLAVLLDRGF